MDIIIRIIQVIFALSLLVLVHEFGHYIFARIFKIRVEKFYLFFPPAIFKYKPKKSDTEFGIGMIPLGGFCKISGMIDESMDTEQLKGEPQAEVTVNVELQSRSIARPYASLSIFCQSRSSASRSCMTELCILS